MGKVGSLAFSCVLLISSAAFAPSYAMAADSPLKILLARARTQAAGGHLDIAVSTWKQVLASEPGNIEALQSIAAAELRLGHQAEADKYLALLKSSGGSAGAVGQLQSMRAVSSDEELLRQATALAQGGQYSSAMAIYRKLYGTNPPAGDTGLMYYDTLAAVPGERKHAVEGLRKLATQLQADARYSITLGRVLTYDASTRQEGVALLRRYPTDRGANDALRQAMVWDEQNKGSVPISSTPLPKVAAAAPANTTSELGMGFRSLNGGSLTAADEHFRAAGREATRGQAHAGLGYVRMRQRDFAGAISEFEQAKEDGNRDVGVTQALANSRFYRSMEEGQSAAQSKDFNAGVTAYRAALLLKPDDGDALTAFGGALLGAGRPKEAIPYLQRALKVNAGSQATARALFVAQSQAHEHAEAIQTAEHLPPAMRSQLNNDPEFLGLLAAAYSGVGNEVQSDRILKRALALSQDDAGAAPSTAKQIQYASLLLIAKRYSTAGRAYRRVLAADPQSLDAWRGVITADHMSGHDAEALHELGTMPGTVAAAAQRETGFLSMVAGIYQSQGQTRSAREMLDRALKVAPSTELQMQLASLEMSGGDKQYATELYAQVVDEHPESGAAWLGWIQSLHAVDHDREALREIENIPDAALAELSSSPDYWQTAAAVYTSVGDKRRAAESIAQVEEVYHRRGANPPADVELQQGWLLLQAGENARLSRVVQQLSSEEELTPDQQAQVVNLWGSWAMQRAAELTRQGNREGAVALLAAGLRAFPSNINLNNALANAYLSDGQPKRAVTLYARQDIAQADAGVCVAAISVALAAGDRKQAQVWLQSTLDRFGRDPKVLELAAQFEQQRGDPKRAAAYYRAALQASGPPTIAELTASSARAVQGSIEPSPQRELLDLLTGTGAEASSVARSREDRQPSKFSRSRSTHTYGNSAFGVPPDTERPAYEGSLSSPERDTPRGRSGGGSALANDEPYEATSQYGGSPSLARQSRSMQLSGPQAGGTHLLHVSTASEPSQGDRTSLYGGGDTSQRGRGSLRKPAEPPVSERPMEDSPFRASQRASAATFPGTDHVELRGALSISPRDLEETPTRHALAPLAMLSAPPTDLIEPLPPLTGMAVVVRQPLSPRQQTQQNLENIESSSSPYQGGDSSYGFHSGQVGLDQLTIFSAAVEQSSMLGMGARLSVLVHPTLLQSGTMLSTAAYQLGTLPLGAVPGAQIAAGVGGEVQLRTRSFGAALGYSPRGFPVENVTGRLLIQPGNGPVTFTFERQPNTTTQLSYAGMRDPGSATSSFPGNVWGGVVNNAASLQVKGGDGNSGWYVQGGGQYITGRHVLANSRVDGIAGAYWSVWSHDSYGKLTVGMNLFGMHYAKNQRLYTYGNGGYFSPGAYLLSSVPVSFDGHSGPRFNYRVTGAVGLQAFQEDASPYFPLDAGLQSAANNPFVAERSSVGANYNFDGEGSYLLTEHWHAGVNASFNNSYDYHNERVSFFLRYAWRPQSLDRTGGPTGLNGTNQTLRPLLLP